jgi:hypothetical protein
MKVYVITAQDPDDCEECGGRPYVVEVKSSEKKVTKRWDELIKENPHLHYDWEAFEVE